MKARNHRIHPRKAGFFALLLSLVGLGTTSCWQVCMYGSPCAEWTVKGKVVNEAGEPISGLQVALGNLTNGGNYYALNTLQTGADGVYELISGGNPISNLQVDVKDIDGEASGGAFRDTSLVVSDLQYKDGDGDWYVGHVEIEVPDITLKKK